MLYCGSTRCCVSARTERSEHDSGGDEESEHQADHHDAGHDRSETPPAHDQDDPAHHADHCRHGQTDYRGVRHRLSHMRGSRAGHVC